MIKPKALKKGDTIGLVGPSGVIRSEGGLEKSIQVLEKQGFKVIVGESCGQKYGYLSGTDDIRAADLNQMFQDPSIDGVFCIKGGYGTPRILDKIDYAMIKENPKLFIGYSDITAIHTALNQKCDLITIHGPMAASDMISDFDSFSEESYLKAITSTEPLGILENPKEEPIKTLVSGKTRGQIVGGNLMLIAVTLGTPYEIDTKGKILFLEDIDEYTYSVDRMLTQLRLAGKLHDCAGIVLGSFKNCVPEYEEYSLSLLEIFQDIVAPVQKPTLYNFMAGHCDTKITLPLGVEAELDGEQGTLKVLESALTL
ncbi:MAG: LD-carboxypeptidase [Thermotaleaceae bacterium]